MAIKALTGLEPEWYEPKGQSEDEKKTRFMLKPLNGRRYMELTNCFKADLTTPDINGRAEVALKHGLVGWENFCDETGNELPFNQSNIDLIPRVILVDIVDEIVIRSEMGDEDRKNS